MEKDDSLWKLYTQDVKRLEGEINAEKQPIHNKTPLSPKPPRQTLPAEMHTLDIAFDLRPSATTTKQLPPQIDRRTAEKLRKGQMPIEGRLDLHGLYQEQARHALRDFIATSAAQGLRCVLVVTGKGKLILEGETPDKHTPGAIKRNFKDWLADEPYHSMILKIQKAQIKDGGEGAYYILLRRRR